MRRVRMLLVGASLFLFTFGFAPAANACKPYNGGSCSPGACHLVVPDPTSDTWGPILECYY